jgi:hypothetical protein
MALALASLTAELHRGRFAALAVAALALALTFRYAVVAAVPIACIVVFLAALSSRVIPSRRANVGAGQMMSGEGPPQSLPLAMLAAAAAALLAVIPVALAFHLLGVPLVHSSTRSFTFAPIPLLDDIRACATIADQLLPVRLLGVLAWPAVVLLFVVIPSVVALRALRRAGGLRTFRDTPLATGTLLAELWVIGYLMLLPLMQSVAYPSFSFDVRILLPLLPMMLAGTACALQIVLSRHPRARPDTTLAALLACCLALASARSLKFWAGETRAHFRVTSAACIGNGAIVDQVRSIAHVIPHDAHLVSNSQAPVWTALHRPVEILDAKDTSNATRPGTILIYVAGTNRCPGVPENDTVPLTNVRTPGSRALATTTSLVVIATAPATPPAASQRNLR